MSGRIGISEVILSALFFLVAIFTISVVLLTYTFDTFSGLFYLVSKVNGFYELFYLLMGVMGCGSLLFFMVKERSIQRMGRLFYIFCGVMFIFFLVNASLGARSYFISEEDTDALRLFFALGYSGQIIDLLFFLCFIVMPFVYYFRTDEVSVFKSLDTYPFSMIPSLNMMIVALFVFAIQPFDKQYWWEWGEIILVFIGLFMICYLYYIRPNIFGSYERFNILLLFLGILVFFISHSVFEGYASQYVAKKALYILMIWCWVLGAIERLRTNKLKRNS
ncbi:hypothetical protein CCZ01_02100 [Helicobacter monodelphidis]|uniref:hypothetical protein n=1 Tax=Helicobacter sp. 15-1451 TaxID=2004995 RepID=UPI000DCE9ED1|nr:hypothetical protein [Helicobacter sp. 15-1451]RAX58600.1 hypothetical protein CCZ01_02100 [Helicobacter sp. 15-1451]